MFQLFRLNDDPSGRKAAVPTNWIKAAEWNRKGHGIFWTPNTFKPVQVERVRQGKKYSATSYRSLSGLTKINYWYCEMDSEEKASEQALVIKKSPLLPSLIIETKRGFHLYWKARDATLDNWNNIQVNRLVPFFCADPKARDAARLLRVPGFFHMKNPKEPFLVRQVYANDVSYSEKEMLGFFRDANVKDCKPEQNARGGTKQNPDGKDIWEKIWNLDCQIALEKLSGSHWVGGEKFSFRRVGSGNQNILVNGKSTSCWLDENNRIGSMDGGGPTIAQWLRWYGTPWKEVIRCIEAELLN